MPGDLSAADRARLKLSAKIQKRMASNDAVTQARTPEHYTDALIARMASRLSLAIPDVERQRTALNFATMWYFTMARSLSTSDLPATKRARLLKRVENQATQLRKALLEAERKARRLLKAHGIDHFDDAEDGPQLEALSIALEIVADPDEVRGWLATVARMAEAAFDAHKIFSSAGSKDNAVRTAIRRPEGVGPNRSWAEDEWLSRILSIYQSLTGKGRGTSVDVESGVACGPLVDFIQLAAEPLRSVGLKHGTDAWRARLRRR